jgi:hypothetical protein
LTIVGPTLLAALASAWGRSSRWVKAIVLAAFTGLVILTAGRSDAVVALSYMAGGVFLVCGCWRVVASYYAAPLVSVALGFVCGGMLGLLPAFVTLAIYKTSAKPSEVEFQAVLVGFVAAGGLLGAVSGAARRPGVRTDFGVYPNPGIGPAAVVPAFKGPPMRFSASQLREMADLLDRHGRTFQLRPFLGRPKVKAPLPGPGAANPTPDGRRPRILLIDGTLGIEAATELLQKLDVLEREDKGKFKEVVAALAGSSEVTGEARKLLLDAGIKLIQEKP